MHDAACHLVISKITHIRYGPPAHVLHRPGLSMLIDLDRLDVAGKISAFFSVNRFNLFSIHERDFGINHKSHPDKSDQPVPLADYIRQMASPYLKGRKIASLRLLAFPRILGFAFNPDRRGRGRGEGRGELRFPAQFLLPHFVRARHFFAHGSRQLIIKRAVRHGRPNDCSHPHILAIETL